MCPEGRDCGLEIGQVEVSPYSEKKSGGPSIAMVAVVAVMIIGLVAAVLIVIYYRRRLRVARKDLNNRWDLFT